MLAKKILSSIWCGRVVHILGGCIFYFELLILFRERGDEYGGARCIFGKVHLLVNKRGAVYNTGRKSIQFFNPTEVYTIPQGFEGIIVFMYY